jgi:uncharacterized membrane protein
MKETIESIDVSVPVRVAYNQWTQFEEFPHFMENVERVEQIDDTTLLWVATIDGKQEQWTARITEQTPDQRIAWKSTNGAGNAGVVTFHKMAPNTTRVTLQLGYEPEGVVEKVGAALGFVDRNIKDDLERFRDFIESRDHETGAWRGEVEQEHRH